MRLSGREAQGFKMNITVAKSKVQGPKKYNYTIGSNLENKERLARLAEKEKLLKKKKVKTV